MAKISITITADEKAFIETLATGTAEEIVTGVVSDWLDSQVNLKLQSKVKTRSEKIAEIG